MPQISQEYGSPFLFLLFQGLIRTLHISQLTVQNALQSQSSRKLETCVGLPYKQEIEKVILNQC